jgi:cell division protease FtsH
MSMFTDELGNIAPMQLAKESPKSRRTVIALTCLEPSLPRGFKTRLEQETLIILVHLPDDTWADAVEDAFKGCLPFSRPPIVLDGENARGRDLRWFKMQAASALAEGRCFVILCDDAKINLNAALATIADVEITLAPPSSKTIRKLMRSLSSESEPIRVSSNLTDDLCKDLDFNEIAMIFRPGLKPAEIVRRLQAVRASKQLPVGQPLRTKHGQDPSTPHLQDLYGYGEAKTWGLELLDDLAAFREGRLPFTALSARVVLTSEPGLGKTSFVRSLARSANLPLVASSVASWFTTSSGYLDGVLRAIDKVFAEAREKAPAILFLDEIDALPSRARLNERGKSFWLPVVTHMLTLLDSAVSAENEKLIIVSATNHAEALDPALLRPGRLDRVIRIDHPDIPSIAGILRQHLGADLSEHDLGPIAQLAVGATGAELMGLVKKARALARMADRPLRLSDLTEALAPTSSGRSAELDRVIAVHEAGHAVVATILMPDMVSHASLTRLGSADGHTRMLLTDGSLMTRASIEDAVTMLLSGYAAEELCFSAASTGSTTDLSTATRLLFLVHGAAGLGETLAPIGKPENAEHALLLDSSLRRVIEKELRQLLQRARTLLRENSDALDAVTDRLLAERILSSQAIKCLVMQTRKGFTRTSRKAIE